jgi:hypothetical protein
VHAKWTIDFSLSIQNNVSLTAKYFASEVLYSLLNVVYYFNPIAFRTKNHRQEQGWNASQKYKRGGVTNDLTSIH